VFEASLADLRAFDREDEGEAEEPAEKFDRMMRERLSAKAGRTDSGWWTK
jgi:hypothetical protein